MRCPVCHDESARDAAACTGCGHRFHDTESPTRTRYDPAMGLAGDAENAATAAASPGTDRQRGAMPSSPGSSTRERHLPGAVIADRYRVISLLGRGGMGEVYRADDLRLGQPVALKFLPRGLQHDAARLQMLLDEVRIARRVAHPNVCRVYDVGEADGQAFICMEFVDGEDLSTLLRRIGRLPRDKAVQIARQLCAGLSAAHEQGIVHRDLKPANIMIDGRGRARITDFGLARETGGVVGRAARAGTPAYMAPEQLEGREATTRSDIYALGLVLYELFTGKQPFQARTPEEALAERSTGSPASPTSYMESFDPETERVILRCLEPDPAKRPRTALGVATALPGGDALAAAIAAGETPSPEVVAAASDEVTVGPVVAWSTVVVCVLFVVFGQLLEFERGVAPDGRNPIVLADRAREILVQLGHPVEGHDSAWGYVRAPRPAARVLFDRAEIDAIRAGEAPPYFSFWYRTSPTPLMPVMTPRARAGDPPRNQPGSALVLLSTGGELLGLEVIPEQAGAVATDRSVDWDGVLALTGLDREGLERSQLTRRPPVFAETTSAWTGEYADGQELRVEASAVDGRVNWLRVFTPGMGEPAITREALPPLFMPLLWALFTTMLVIGAWLARSNWLSGRADRRGALRVALVVGGSILLFGLLSSTHRPVVGEVGLVYFLLQGSLFFLVATAIFYIALEPSLRRSWPHRIVTWSRVLEGRFNDPLVGYHLLVGAVAGVVMGYLDEFGLYLGEAFGAAPKAWSVLVPLEAGWRLPNQLAMWPASLTGGVMMGLGFAVLLLAFVRVTRYDQVGALLFSGMMTFGLALRDQITSPWVIVAIFVSCWIPVQAFLRFGLLAYVTAFALAHMIILTPTTQYSDNWFSTASTVLASTAIVVAAYGAWIATRGRRAHPSSRGQLPASTGPR